MVVISSVLSLPCLECFVATIPSMRWVETFKSCILNISWPSKVRSQSSGGMPVQHRKDRSLPQDRSR